MHLVQCEACHYIIVLSEPDNDLFLSEFCVYHSCAHVLVLVQTLQSLLYKVSPSRFLNWENIDAAQFIFVVIYICRDLQQQESSL